MLRHGPRTHYGEGSPQTVISGLNRTALALAVYASPPALPQRTQDSLLVAGQALPDGNGYPQGFNERFPSCFLHLVPLSQAFLAQSGSLAIGRSGFPPNNAAKATPLHQVAGFAGKMWVSCHGTWLLLVFSASGV